MANVDWVPLACTPSQWTGAYFDNRDLTGTPKVRCDTAVNFDWGTASPIPGSMPVDNFSVRWATTRVFTAGDYQFTATADDGVRVKVDNGPWIIDAWKDQGPTTYQTAIPLTAGEHTVTVEYYEKGGGAVANVSWVAL